VERATDAAVAALSAQAFAGLMDQGRKMSAQEAASYPADDA